MIAGGLCIMIAGGLCIMIAGGLCIMIEGGLCIMIAGGLCIMIAGGSIKDSSTHPFSSTDPFIAHHTSTDSFIEDDHCYTEFQTTLKHSVYYRSLYAAALLHEHLGHLGQRHLRLRKLLEGLQPPPGRGH